MDWEIIVHENEKFIEVITSGGADKDGSLKMATAINENMWKHKIKRVLVDHSNISEVSGNTIDVYYRPKILRIIGAVFGLKIAEIIKIEHIKHFRIFEIACKTLGFQISVFHEREKAINWLLN
jgi:hypothetical protein